MIWVNNYIIWSKISSEFDSEVYIKRKQIKIDFK